MKTYKGMLNVVCCWCLCLSLCSISLAENATAEKPVEDQPTITKMITPAEKIALQKQKDKEIYEAKIESLRLAKEQEKADYKNLNSNSSNLERFFFF